LANRRTIVGCLRAIGRITGHEIGVDKNTTVVLPPPLMSTIQELGGLLATEAAAVTTPAPAPSTPARSTSPTVEVVATDAAFTTGDSEAPATRQ
jgi:hypothetical protein